MTSASRVEADRNTKDGRRASGVCDRAAQLVGARTVRRAGCAFVAQR
jgi:hypothetical protein